MQLPALARSLSCRAPLVRCGPDFVLRGRASLSSEVERRCQPVAEKQGGLGAQLSVMSLHPLPSVVPALANVQDTPGELYPERLVRSNVRGSIVSIIKVTQATFSGLLAMRALTIFRYGLSCALVAAFSSAAPGGVGAALRVKNWGRRLRECLGGPGQAPLEGELGRLLEELKQHDADASATENQ
jgi:hypothetical protein